MNYRLGLPKIPAQHQVGETIFTDVISWSDTFKIPMKFDVKYAGTDNFFRKKVYQSAAVFLEAECAKDLVAVHEALIPLGFGLLIFDGYRPWSVTKLFWDESDPSVREFLANPKEGSSHNRGSAVDLSMYWIKNGKEVQMPSLFDEMNEKAYRDYSLGDPEALDRRDLLIRMMESHGFQGIPNEWWHFNHRDRHHHGIFDFSFEEIRKFG